MSQSSPSERVAALADEFLNRHRRGERPSIREYTDKYPDLVAEIQEVFPAVALLENVAIGDETLDGPKVQAPALKQVGDFRIVREVGRGGMGVVYKAEQMSLSRFVALKLLPSRFTATGQERQRFLREARTAAKLHHTNIVPVFGFGEVDGTPYYAMQFIRGQGLDTVIEELRGQIDGAKAKYGDTALTRAADLARSLVTGEFAPPPDTTTAPDAHPSGHSPSAVPATGADTAVQMPTVVLAPPPPSGITASKPNRRTLLRSIVGIGVQVARALDHAHQQGVLHRDIKPSNLLLDADGTVWVTDFGLAKAEGLPDITRDGDLLGTLRYMPPEAFDGKFDARSDVYSLGLTLFELLALRPVFDEHDRNKLLKQVSSAQSPRLRKLVPVVPRDLATIIHKAIQRDPDRRYQTAAALADDLQRFLDDRPIAARPVSALEHGWRACKRNPVLSSMGAVALLGLVVGLVGALWGQSVAESREKDASEQKTLAERAANALRDERDEVKKLNSQLEEQRALLAERLYVSDLNRAKVLLDAGNVAVAGDLLARNRPAPGQPDRRGFEWYYLNRVANTAAVIPTRHAPNGGNWQTLAYSPNGQWLAFGTRGELRVWSVAKNREELDLPLPATSIGVAAVAFTRDNKYLLAAIRWAGRSELQVWDLNGGGLRKAIPIKTNVGRALALTPNGDRLFVPCWDKLIRVYDTTTWEEKEPLRGHTGAVSFVAVSPTGSHLSSCGVDGNLRLWPLEKGESAVVTLDPKYGVTGGTFRPDGKQLVCSSDRRLQVFDLTTHPPRLAYSRIANGAGFAYSPDGQTLTVVTSDGPIRRLSAATGEDIGQFRGHTQESVSVAFAPDGSALASLGADRTVRVWEMSSVSEGRPIGGTVRGRTVALAQDGQTVVVGSGFGEAVLRVFDVTTGKLKKVIPVHKGEEIHQIKFSPDGRRLASVGSDGVLRLWDATTWDAKPVWTAACLPPARYQMGARDVDFSQDGKFVLACTWVGGQIGIYDSATGRQLRGWQLPIEKDTVWIPKNADGFLAARFSPDGTRVVATVRARDGGRDFAIVWDISGEHERELFQIRVPDTSVSGVVFSPDGKELAGGVLPEGIVRFWDAETGKLIPGKELRGFGSRTARIVYTADGSRIFTCGEDRSVGVWSATNGDQLLVLNGHDDGVLDAAIAPDQTRLVTVSYDKTVRVWDAPRK